MKRITLKTIAILLIPFMQIAQSNKVQSAWRALQDYETSVKEGSPDVSYLNKAKDNIDLARNHADTKDKPKTFVYTSKIYYKLFLYNWEQEKKKLSAKLTNKSQIAEEAFGNVDTTEFSIAGQAMAKVFEMEAKEKEKTYSMELAPIAMNMMNDMQNLAVGRFKVKKYDEAISLFEDCYDGYKMLGKKDTGLIMNAMISADKAKKYDKVIQIGKKVIDDKLSKAIVYSDMHFAYLNLNYKEKAEAILLEGLGLFPNDKGLILNYINICIQQKKESTAMNYIDKAIEKDPNNCALFLVKGNVFDNQANPKSAATGKDTTKPANFNDLMVKAEENYLKAIACNPEGFEGNFNLGAVYNNWGNWYSQNVSGSNSADNDKKSQTYWGKAVQYLEKCVTLSPDDKSLKKNLIRLYRMTSQTEKADALKKQMEK
ncbi:MAG: tetratricopeptide repeat protein [Bacteroidota bacterium]|jgi:tetratricopeptide (TPR) repeat protein